MDRAEHLPGIDALRGIAAVLVALVFHQHYLFGPYMTGPLDGLPFFSLVHQWGWAFVDLFFVISGFIFSHVYLDAAGLRPGTTLRSFAVARFARLYPLHLVTLLAVAGLVVAGRVPMLFEHATANDLRHFLLNLVMLQESGLNVRDSFNMPAWSIAVEVICYAAFILAALRGSRVLLVATVGLIAAGILIDLTAPLPLPPRYDVGRGLVGYFAGHLLWRYQHLLTNRSALLAVALVGIVCVPIANPWSLTPALLSLTTWPAAVLLALRCKALSAAPFQWLGARSYSIYMIHAPVYMFTCGVFFDRGVVPPQLWTPVALATGGAILLLSDLSYRYLEQPMRGWIKGRGAPAPKTLRECRS